MTVKMKTNNVLTEYQITDVINRFRFQKENTVKQISDSTGVKYYVVERIVNDWLRGKIK